MSKVTVTCMCGHEKELWKDTKNPPCEVCRCDMEIAANVKSGAIESVTQWPDCKRIKTNIELWKQYYWPETTLKRYCLWCGVTLSGKRKQAKTCSGKCRKSLSRSGVKDDLIIALRAGQGYGTEYKMGHPLSNHKF